jgi:hypothetical protein
MGTFMDSFRMTNYTNKGLRSITSKYQQLSEFFGYDSMYIVKKYFAKLIVNTSVSIERPAELRSEE